MLIFYLQLNCNLHRIYVDKAITDENIRLYITKNEGDTKELGVLKFYRNQVKLFIQQNYSFSKTKRPGPIRFEHSHLWNDSSWYYWARISARFVAWHVDHCNAQNSGRQVKNKGNRLVVSFPLSFFLFMCISRPAAMA